MAIIAVAIVIMIVTCYHFEINLRAFGSNSTSSRSSSSSSSSQQLAATLRRGVFDLYCLSPDLQIRLANLLFFESPKPDKTNRAFVLHLEFYHHIKGSLKRYP